MAYVTPELTLVGQATSVVLSNTKPLRLDNPQIPNSGDAGSSLESEW